jgi:hypothetical protein
MTASGDRRSGGTGPPPDRVAERRRRSSPGFDRPRRRDSLTVTCRHTPPILRASGWSTWREEEVVRAFARVVRILHDRRRIGAAQPIGTVRWIGKVPGNAIRPAAGAAAPVTEPAAPLRACFIARIVADRVAIRGHVCARRGLTASHLAPLTAAPHAERQQDGRRSNRQKYRSHSISPRKSGFSSIAGWSDPVDLTTGCPHPTLYIGRLSGRSCTILTGTTTASSCSIPQPCRFATIGIN